MMRGRRSFVATVLAVGTAGCVSSGIETNTTVDTNDDKDLTTDGEGELTVEETPAFEGVRYGDFEELEISDVEYSDGSISGRLENQSNQLLERINLRADLYDENGDLVDERGATAADIKPGSGWWFDIITQDTLFSSYEVTTSSGRWA